MKTLEELNALTNDELRRLLLALNGWEMIPCERTSCTGNLIAIKGDKTAFAPNYPEDLNACHAVVTALNDEQRHAYAVILSGMLWLPENTRGWNDWRDTLVVSEATARQRTTALILTLQKP